MQSLQLHHPGGLGEILLVADGGSWLRGVILERPQPVKSTQNLADSASDVSYVAIA